MEPANIEFLQQFREETIALPKEQRPDKLLEEIFTQSSLIRRLITRIEREDQAKSRRLSEYIKKTLASFTAFIRMDPTSIQYFIRLSTEMRQLLDWIASYQDKTGSPLLKRLKCIAAQKTWHREIKFFCCRDINNTETAMQIFSDGLCHYYETLCRYFEQESEASGSTMVVSETGRRLYCLLTLIGEQIEATGSTIAGLKTWRLQSRNIEIQEIYN